MQFPIEDTKGMGRSSTSEDQTTVLQPRGKKPLEHSLRINHLGSTTDFSGNCQLPDYVSIIRYAVTVRIFAA